MAVTSKRPPAQKGRKPDGTIVVSSFRMPVEIHTWVQAQAARLPGGVNFVTALRMILYKARDQDLELP